MDDEERADAVASCSDLMTELEAFLPARRSQRSRTWQDVGFPVIERGVHAVFPLLVQRSTNGCPPHGDDHRYIDDRLWRDWGFRYGGHDYRVGTFRESDEWGKEVLGAKLRETGPYARQPTWWDIADHVVVFVSARDPRSAATSALHVVPRDWVFAGLLTPRTKRALSHCRRVVRTVAAANLRWDPAPYVPDSGALWVTTRSRCPDGGA